MILHCSQDSPAAVSGASYDSPTNHGSSNYGCTTTGHDNSASVTHATHLFDQPAGDDRIVSSTLTKSFFHMNESTRPDFLCEMRDTRLLGADFFMASADLYSLVPFSNVSVGKRNQGMCLILAATSLLDAVGFDELLARNTHGGSGGGSGSATASTNGHPPPSAAWTAQCLNRARHNASTARSLLVAEGADLLGLRFVGGDDDDEDMTQLRNMALVTEFSTLCKMSSIGANTSGLSVGQGSGLAQGQGQGQGQVHDNNLLQTFLLTKENDFLSLSALQLKRCAEIASELGGTVDVVQKLLTLSLQICLRGAPPDHLLMGELFRRLIINSPARRDALDHVRKFEQLATGCAFSRNADMGDDEGPYTCPFDVEDVDSVASTSYNYGLTMLDFGQAGLAEVFVSKALSLLPFASSTLQLWRDRIQDTYMAVLKAKEASTPLGDGLSTLATLAVSYQ